MKKLFKSILFGTLAGATAIGLSILPDFSQAQDNAKLIQSDEIKLKSSPEGEGFSHIPRI